MCSLLTLDANINVSKLEKELRTALDFDVKYKQTDNMKKRACKVATDYDEFKSMVACAHLKTLRLQFKKISIQLFIVCRLYIIIIDYFIYNQSERDNKPQ